MSPNAMKSMKLKRVLGFTPSGRNSFICQPKSENLIYIAGCVVVVSNPRLKTQNHLISNSKLSITTLAATEDGRYLATSNCGSKAQVHVWDLDSLGLVAELPGHQAGASAMCFSPNHQFLVTVGSKANSTLNVWDWQQERLVAEHQLTGGTKVRAVSFASDGSYFVSIGEAHLKYWLIQYSDDSTQRSEAARTTMVNIEIRGARLGDQRNASFCDVKCGRGSVASSTFCITKSGYLCELNNQRILHKWVDLRVAGANSLNVGENIIAVGCSNGIVRCFNTSELKFLKNLPRPHLLGQDSANQRNLSTNNKYPDVICSALDEKLCSLACAYNDRSIYLWHFSDINFSSQVIKKHSVQYHSSCIWGIDMCQSGHTAQINKNQLSPGSFITCSSDDTLRVWSPSVFNSTLSSKTSNQQQNPTRDSHGNELQRIIFTDKNLKFLCDTDGGAQLPEDPETQNYDNNEGLRCLKISPDGRHLAAGSRSGTIKIFDLSMEFASPSGGEIKCIAAHDAEVLCLEYSDPSKFAGFFYLASSSRDKLIHIFDAANDYNFLQTIDDHLSSITSLRFINNRARGDSLQLVSCGADQKIIFRNGLRLSSGQPEKQHDELQLNFVCDQQIEGKSTFYDLELDSESSCLMAACQDSMIRLYNLARIKYQSSFNGSSGTLTSTRQEMQPGEGATLIKIALDPSCTFLATSSTNKTLSIYDYQRGECIASVSAGLSDLITDMKFSPDGHYLVTCSGDGCIFVWKSPIEIVNATSSTTTTASGLLEAPRPTSQLACEQQRVHLSPAPTSPTTTYKSTTSRPQQAARSLLPEWAKRQMHAGLEQNQDLDDELNSMIYQQDLGPRSLATTGLGDYEPSDSSEVEDDELNYVASVKADADGQLLGSTRNLSGAGMRPQNSSLIRRRQVSTEGSKDSQLKAKMFQSRDNLDRIASRERFVSEALTQMGSDPARKSAVAAKLNNNGSLSGLFANSNNPATRRSAALGAADPIDQCGLLSPGSSTLNGKQQITTSQSDGDSALGAMLASLPSGLSRQGSQMGALLDNTIDRDADYLRSPPSTNSMSLNRLHNQASRRDSVSSNGHHTLQPRNNLSLGRAAGTNRYTSKTRSGGLRNSKSECNLVAGVPPPTHYFENSGAGGTNNNLLLALLDNLPTCEKLDLGQVNLSAMLDYVDADDDDDELSSRQQEVLCQYVVDELQAISKFATRLHQRVIQTGNQQSNGGGCVARSKLSNLLARGVQNSMDILSIVQPSPSRSRNGQPQHQIDHNQQRQRNQDRNQKQNRFQSQMNLDGSSAAQIYSQARRQQQPLRSGSSTLGLFPGAGTGEDLQSAATRTPTKPKTSLIATGQQQKVSKGNNVSVDQVLEAYSDRLFRMVQDRMMIAEQQQQHGLQSSGVATMEKDLANLGPALAQSPTTADQLTADNSSEPRESAIYLADNQSA